MSNLRTLLAVFLGLGLISASGRSDTPPKTEPPQPKEKPPFRLPTGHELMVAKLKNAQSLLEGIALNDFKKIDKSTEELLKIANAAEFLNAYKGKEYELQMLLFKRTAETIKAKAKDKNLDGVLLGYNDMTMTCLKCHQHVRDKGDAALPLPDGDKFAGK